MPQRHGTALPASPEAPLELLWRSHMVFHLGWVVRARAGARLGEGMAVTFQRSLLGPEGLPLLPGDSHSLSAFAALSDSLVLFSCSSGHLHH